MDKGYLYHLLPYTGKNFDYDKVKGIGATIIDKFSEEHKNSNFHFIFDSYYCNLYSLKRLYDYNINFTCTFNKNRKLFPKIIRKCNLNKGETKLFVLKILILIFIFKMKKSKFNLHQIYMVHKGINI